jgi:glycosyltransferase involved in cell wall biosynthesis
MAFPIVSVAMTSYNSASQLRRSFDSILAQIAKFPIEIVLGDDCSNDTTIEIARSYQQKYPRVVTILARPKNIGIQRNYYDTFENCHGKYIAWLDADDHWTDTKKLAIQVQALESDPSVSVCCHFVRRVTDKGDVVQDRYPRIPAGRYGVRQIIDHNFVPSPSIMFRNGLHRNLPPWYFELHNMSDWPLLILGALSGDILLLDEVMADYMLSSGSSFEAKGELFREKIVVRLLEHADSMLPREWHRAVHSNAGKHYETVAYLLRTQGEYSASRAAAWKAFSLPALRDNLASKTKALFTALIRETEYKIHKHRAGRQ